MLPVTVAFSHVILGLMHRVGRDRLFHGFISDVKFERRLLIGLKQLRFIRSPSGWARCAAMGLMVVHADICGSAAIE